MFKWQSFVWIIHKYRWYLGRYEDRKIEDFLYLLSNSTEEHLDIIFMSSLG